MSIRDSNLLMVVDPDSRRIRWWQIGPWLRQHDPEFREGGTIAVFNNKTYYSTEPFSASRTSNILEVDPASGEYRLVYGDRDGQAFFSVYRGQIDAGSMGNLLITESEGGRVFETDSDGNTVWEYVNRYDAQRVAEINAARLYPSDYFTVEEWSCARPEA